MVKFLSLFVMLCMLVVPVAHAAGIGCEAHASGSSKQSKEFSVKAQDEKKDVSQTEHHCCATHASFNQTAPVYHYTPSVVAISVVIANDGITSRIIWPLTEPPIHA